MESLFQSHNTQNIPIFLVDASGSVKTEFRAMSIFDFMKNIIIGMKYENIRLLFWNSEDDKPFFTNGVYRIPFIVKRDTINQTFMHVNQNIKGSCLTHPHIAFDGIPAEWIDNKDMTRIYYITDGQIGPSNIPYYQAELGKSIKNLFARHNNIQLSIITVESRYVDMSTTESTTNAAGCDVYNIIIRDHLTNYITKFVSHTLNNQDGFVHINKNIPPAGHVPYGDKFFSVLRINDFISYIMHEIETVTNDEDKLLQIIQNLSATLSVLTKGKQINVTNGIIDTFCRLFQNTKIDPMFAQFILTDAVKKEGAGTAEIYSAYRSQLKDLYKRANDLLQDNVKNALSINDHFTTMPMYGKLIVGSHRMINKDIRGSRMYRNGAVSIGQMTVPVIPFEHATSQMNEQCLRQWVRFIISTLDRVNVMDDSIMFIVLGRVLQVVMSDVSDEIKNSFRRLGHIMLRKKCKSVDMTELARLESGELPMDNGGMENSFFNLMSTVSSKLVMTLNPFVLWYAMCLALNNEQLIVKQLIHCGTAIKTACGDINPRDLLATLRNLNIITPIVAVEIHPDATLDYTCLITMEDTSNVGGYKFVAHQTRTQNTCCPQNVLSVAGYTSLLGAGEACVCPMCYTCLSERDFAHIGAKPQVQDLTSVFTETDLNIFDTVSPIAPQQQSNTRLPNVIYLPNVSQQQVMLTSNQKRVVVLLSGTVGGGKSLFAQKLYDTIIKNGGLAVNEGTDKYCKTGIQTRDAAKYVTNAINRLIADPTDIPKCVIIDTCGENNKGITFFGVNFTGWEIHRITPNYISSQLDNYLAWSLRNVLQRGATNSNASYYLNPVNASLKICVDVHMKKAKNLFGQKSTPPLPMLPATTQDAISLLNSRADEYQLHLTHAMPIDDEVAKFYATL